MIQGDLLFLFFNSLLFILVRSWITPVFMTVSVCIKLKPIFHLKTGLGWVPDANDTKDMKCTCPTQKFCVGTQCNLYSTGLRLGFASGKSQPLGFASGKNAKNWRHLTQKIPTCWDPQRKSLASGLLPNANPQRQVFCVAVEYTLKDIVEKVEIDNIFTDMITSSAQSTNI